jgi:hypothetical protein
MVFASHVDVKPISSTRPQFNGVADLASQFDGPRTNVSSYQSKHPQQDVHASSHGSHSNHYTHEEYQDFYEDEDYLDGEYEEGEYQDGDYEEGEYHDGDYDDQYSEQQSYEYGDEEFNETPQASERHDLEATESHKSGNNKGKVMIITR